MKSETPSTSTKPTPIRRMFGSILRKIRKVRGKSIYELARDAQVDAGYISRLENAHRNPPSPRILQRFAKALNFRVDLLMMAAGYLEYDKQGRPLSEEQIIKLVEDELTNRAGIQTSRLPEATAVKSTGDIHEVIRQLEEFKKSLLDALKEGPTFELPVLGQIPAGFPVGVEENTIDNLAVERTGLPKDPDLFALRVEGESLRDIGIVEGDYVVLSPMLKNAIEQGSVCAVRLDGDEVTLKRVFLKDDHAILRSANPEYPDIKRQNVSIIGKVVRLVRQFN